MRRWCRDHSLSIVLLLTGWFVCMASIPLAEGTWFDLVSQTGGALFTAGLVNLLAGPLREVNRPEAPPKRRGKR